VHSILSQSSFRIVFFSSNHLLCCTVKNSDLLHNTARYYFSFLNNLFINIPLFLSSIPPYRLHIFKSKWAIANSFLKKKLNDGRIQPPSSPLVHTTVSQPRWYYIMWEASETWKIKIWKDVFEKIENWKFKSGNIWFPECAFWSQT